MGNKTKYPGNTDRHQTTPVPAKAYAAITPAQTRVNTAKAVPGGGLSVPNVWSAPTNTTVTTDFSGVDYFTEYNGLQVPGQRASGMDDAMVGTRRRDTCTSMVYYLQSANAQFQQ